MVGVFTIFYHAWSWITFWNDIHFSGHSSFIAFLSKHELILAFLNNTHIAIAPSVDKGWIVIWITVVNQGWFARTKNEYQFIPVKGCHQAPASYFKVLLWSSVSNENSTFCLDKLWKEAGAWWQPWTGTNWYSLFINSSHPWQRM